MHSSSVFYFFKLQVFNLVSHLAPSRLDFMKVFEGQSILNYKFLDDKMCENSKSESLCKPSLFLFTF